MVWRTERRVAAPLKIPVEFVKWRIRSDDLALLEFIHGDGNVNAAVRDLIHAYCERVRERRLGKVG